MCKKNIAKWIFFGAIFMCVAIAAYGSLVMLLWNWLMPDLFNLTEITFWQSLGLIALIKILVLPSFIGGKSKKEKFWKYRMKKKYSHLSDEDKAVMKEKFMQKCGPWGMNKVEPTSQIKRDSNAEE